MSHLAGLAGSVAVGLIARTTAASAFPDRPVSIIVPWAAGGGTDTVGRTFAAGFEQELGVVVNVINCLGGGGISAADRPARLPVLTTTTGR